MASAPRASSATSSSISAQRFGRDLVGLARAHDLQGGLPRALDELPREALDILLELLLWHLSNDA
jgi:hypothetical protein